MYIFCLIIFILKVFINIDLIKKTVKEIRFWILLSKVKLFENIIFFIKVIALSHLFVVCLTLWLVDGLILGLVLGLILCPAFWCVSITAGLC